MRQEIEHEMTRDWLRGLHPRRLHISRAKLVELSRQLFGAERLHRDGVDYWNSVFGLVEIRREEFLERDFVLIST